MNDEQENEFYIFLSLSLSLPSISIFGSDGRTSKIMIYDSLNRSPPIHASPLIFKSVICHSENGSLTVSCYVQFHHWICVGLFFVFFFKHLLFSRYLEKNAILLVCFCKRASWKPSGYCISLLVQRLCICGWSICFNKNMQNQQLL